MNWKILALTGWFIVISATLFWCSKAFLFKLDWTFVSSAESPNGRHVIKYYQSTSEAGHAPYGDNLVIESWGTFPSPRSSETFFAGYCGKGFEYQWADDENIEIQCTTNSDSIRTQAIMIHGIKVIVNAL